MDRKNDDSRLLLEQVNDLLENNKSIGTKGTIRRISHNGYTRCNGKLR